MLFRSDEGLGEADVVVRQRIENQRLIPTPMEVRGAAASYDAVTGEYTVWLTSQDPHIMRLLMTAFVFGIPETKMRCIALHVGGGRRLDHVLHGAVAPADLGGILVGRVLSVVDDEIRSREKLLVSRVLASPRDGVTGGEAPRVRFVVRRVDDDHARALEPVADGERGVMQILRRHLDVTELEAPLDEVVVAHRRSKVVEGEGKIGVLHLPGERLAQRGAEAARRVHVPLVAGLEQRLEEGEALEDRKSTRLNSSHMSESRMPSSA